MARAVRAPAAPRLVTVREACAELRISVKTFRRHWAGVFTDTRAASERHCGVPRLLFADEVEQAVTEGGRGRARAAVLALRRTLGRA